jgi:membrane-bound serine protease (ClpP class)
MFPRDAHRPDRSDQARDAFATLWLLARRCAAIASLIALAWTVAPVAWDSPARGDAKPQAKSADKPATPGAATPTTPTTPTPSLFDVPAHRAARNVAIIPIKGTIDGGGRFGESVMARSVERRMRTAIRAGADALVFEFDTPGGELGASLRIARLIKDARVSNTIAWIRPQALSGGAVAALACREMVTADPADFGDAMPIQMTREGPRAVRDAELLKKVLPPLVKDVRESVRRHNDAFGAYLRDEYLAIAMVANDVELWWVRNPKTGVEVAIDRAEFEILFPGQSTGGSTRLAIAPGTGTPSDASQAGPPVPGLPAGSRKLAQTMGSQSASASEPASQRPAFTEADRGAWELVEKITDGSAPATFGSEDLAHYNLAVNRIDAPDGKAVLQPIETDEDLKAFLGASYVRRLDSSWSEGAVLFLTNPWVRGFLIVVFLVALFAEMAQPGASIPGIIAIVALALFLAPPLLIGMASWWEVLAIVAGLVLLGVEAFALPGFGVAGGLGLLLLFAGLLGTFLPAGTGMFPATEEGKSRLLWGVLTLLASCATAGAAIYFLARNIEHLPIIGKFVLQTPPAEEVPGAWTGPVVEEVGPVAEVGETGVAITPMHPAGRVEVGGRVIDAVAEFGFIKAGQPVRVVRVDGIRVGVERTDAPAAG